MSRLTAVVLTYARTASGPTVQVEPGMPLPADVEADEQARLLAAGAVVESADPAPLDAPARPSRAPRGKAGTRAR